VIVTGTVFQWV